MTQQLDPVVEADYIIVFFYSGMNNKPTWSWIREAYNVLDRKYKKNLKNIYVVHPTMWHRFLMNMVGVFVRWDFSAVFFFFSRPQLNMNSKKVVGKVVYIHQLEELGKHMPLKQLYIPEPVKAFEKPSSSNSTFHTSAAAPSSSSSSSQASAQFGVALDKLSLSSDGVPLVLVLLTDHIRKEGLDVEGIFRRSPSSAHLNEVKVKLNQGGLLFFLLSKSIIKKHNGFFFPLNLGQQVNLSDYDIHVATVLIKMFFRELPTPLFPDSLHDAIIAVHCIPTGLFSIDVLLFSAPDRA